jgi:hypothetical protein
VIFDIRGKRRRRLQLFFVSGDHSHRYLNCLRTAHISFFSGDQCDCFRCFWLKVILESSSLAPLVRSNPARVQGGCLKPSIHPCWDVHAHLLRIIDGVFWPTASSSSMIGTKVGDHRSQGNRANAEDLVDTWSRFFRRENCFFFPRNLLKSFTLKWLKTRDGVWANGVVDRAPACHLGDPGSNLGQA